MDQPPISEPVPAKTPPAVTPPAISTRRKWIAAAAASTHLLGLSLATLFASIEIKSIMYNGFICSCTGVIAAVFAAQARRWRTFYTLMMTPILAVCLVVLESIINLGPAKAAIPFSVVFLVHQTCSSILLIGDLRSDGIAAENRLSGKFTIRTLMALMVIVAAFFSIWRLAITTNNATCVGAAVILVVLNVAGIAMVYIRHRFRER